MKFRVLAVATLSLLAHVDGRLGNDELLDSNNRKLEAVCKKVDTGFELVDDTSPVMSAPKKSTPASGPAPAPAPAPTAPATDAPFEGARTIYEYVRDGIPYPTCGDLGQNEPFQGAKPLFDDNKDECVKVNICHGNAGHGWNSITVDRSSIGEDTKGNGGHAEKEHNDRNASKRPDYFPGTYSLPNPAGAGKNNAYIDENCVFRCPEGDDACQAIIDGTETEAPATASPTKAPTASPTKSPTASPTKSPTPSPTATPTANPTPSPTAPDATPEPTAGRTLPPDEETFPIGSTVEVDGSSCVLQDDCTCEDPDDIAEERMDDTVIPSGTKGDPHFIMFNGNHFDFHGGCDLVLVDAPDFNNGQGLKIHIRTKIMTWFSYVERAVIQIGNDKFEVKGGFASRRFWHNGHILPGRKLTKENGILPVKVGGFEIHYQTQRDHISWKISIHIDDKQVIALRTIKDYMRVDIEQPNKETFGKTLGLMGSFEDGLMLARDGATIVEDPDLFGQEWQVQEQPSLFHEAEGPQYPTQCQMPELTRSIKRLLAESSVTYEDAEKACAHLQPGERDDCVYDVIATSDSEIAGAY